MSRRSRYLVRRALAAALLLLLLTAGWSIALTTRNRTREVAKPLSPVEAGCKLGPNVVERIQNGLRLDRSPEIVTVPQAPNYLGSFAVTSHSGPWDYLQKVPLVAYGPKHVPARGPVTKEATLADVYPTVEDWTKTEMKDRVGSSLVDAVKAARKPPKMLVFLMWDGVGRNVLERWPNNWPNLKRLEEEGTSYINATVGSSPSITPSTHATFGTGAFPNRHGITGIQYRGAEGDVEIAFEGREPKDMELSTFADDYDRALDNEPKVGLLGLRIWHIPMMGHGAALPGADRDQLVLIGFDQKIYGNQDLYETPRYLRNFPGLQARINELDQNDGVKDGEWRGHPIADEHDNPAWARYQTDVLFETWDREDYGRDATPDMFFLNYKMTDVVGHQYSMDSDEMGDVVQSQDEELGRILDYLDRNVGDYVLLLTADHGHTPSADRSGAWPIAQGELEDDLNRRFDVPQGQELAEAVTAVGPFIDPQVMEDAGTDLDEIARFLNGYTIRDNWPGRELPAGYQSRGDERVFEAAFPSERLDDVISCKSATAAGAGTP